MIPCIELVEGLDLNTFSLDQRCGTLDKLIWSYYAKDDANDTGRASCETM
jgi:hypothetical protein